VTEIGLRSTEQALNVLMGLPAHSGRKNLSQHNSNTGISEIDFEGFRFFEISKTAKTATFPAGNNSNSPLDAPW
jgi:hypothetical protein